jgi:NAD(P)-dependent dehydrogenase (short-subunit alcohol dehydrogenase family)
MEVNLFGALHLVQAVTPSMKERGEGRIILMNSGASTDPPPTLGAYAASKAALASLVRTIAVELSPHGIRANGIQLGPMTGDNFRGYLENLAREAGRSYEEELTLYNEQFALRYTPTTEECAGTALFLASDLARPITGQSIAVNGGKWFLT